MDNQSILEFAREFHKIDFYRNIPFWQILSSFERNSDKLIIIKDRIFRGGAIYLKLSDNMIRNIFTGEKTIEDMDDLIKDNGDNIHFIFVKADSLRIILKGLRTVIKNENPKTISWFKPDLSFRFINFRR